MIEDTNANLTELTAEVVAAYLTHNNVAVADLPNLIASTYTALSGATTPVQPAAPTLTPAVPVKKSITPDFLISLEDGNKYKSLRRHLNSRGMTPEEYRAKWGLPKDYPMVAAAYSAQRSSLAKSLGLGRKAAPTPAPETVAPKKRGPKPKAA